MYWHLEFCKRNQCCWWKSDKFSWMKWRSIFQAVKEECHGTKSIKLGFKALSLEEEKFKSLYPFGVLMRNFKTSLTPTHVSRISLRQSFGAFCSVSLFSPPPQVWAPLRAITNRNSCDYLTVCWTPFNSQLEREQSQVVNAGGMKSSATQCSFSSCVLSPPQRSRLKVLQVEEELCNNCEGAGQPCLWEFRGRKAISPR